MTGPLCILLFSGSLRGQATNAARLLDPAVMGPPIVWLASDAAAGVHDERIIATEFETR